MYQPHISIPVGIVIGLLASFVQSLGLTIQRKSHVLNQFLPEHEQHVEHRRPLWLLGFAIFISSNVLGSLVQIASLPVVILAPLGAVSLLWNAFFARFILGDIFSPWMILGTILIAGGATLIAMFGIVPEPTRSLEDLLQLFRRPAFVLYFSTLGVVVFACLVITHITDYYSSQYLIPPMTSSSSPTPRSVTPISPKPSSSFPVTVPESMMTDAAPTTERTPLLDPKSVKSLPEASLFRDSTITSVRSIYHTRLLLALSYASFSGVISGMCLLFAKSGVELLLVTLTGHNQFWRWQAWALVLGLVAFALLQLWYLHKALVLADPTLVCPLAFCFYNLSSIVNGLIYFDQFSLIPPLHLGLIVLGIFILLGGVWVVTIQSGGVNPNFAKKAGLDEDVSAVSTGGDIECGSRGDSDGGSMEGSDVASLSLRGPIHLAPREVETLPDSIHVPSTSAGDIDLGFAQSSVFSQTYRAVQSPERQYLVCRTDSQLAGLFSPARRPSRRRRSMVHASNEASSSTSYAQISPPLMPFGGASTLGSGLQIGLSPVSPGFAVVPRERGRRSSELLLGVGHGFADVVIDATQTQQDVFRRRTVSEGDTRRRASVPIHSRSISEHDDTGTLDCVDRGVDSNSQDMDTRSTSKARQSTLRWRWLRKVFRGH